MKSRKHLIFVTAILIMTAIFIFGDHIQSDDTLNTNLDVSYDLAETHEYEGATAPRSMSISLPPTPPMGSSEEAQNKSLSLVIASVFMFGALMVSMIYIYYRNRNGEFLPEKSFLDFIVGRVAIIGLLGILAISAFLFVFSDEATAAGEQYYVDSSNTDGDDDGTSWATAFRYLQDGLAAASSGDWIYVAAGTYYPDEGVGQTNDARGSTFNILSGVRVYGGYPTGGGTREWETNVTTLSGDLGQNDSTSGNGDNASSVVTFINVSSTTILDGFTIRAGNASWISPWQGGGIYIIASGISTSSTPQLTNCTISDNSASDGGGMSIRGVSGGRAYPTLTNCTISGNSALYNGGGIHNEGDSGAASPWLWNCIISGNSAERHGGGIHNEGDSGTASPRLTNCTISGNSADAGGGMYNYGSSGTVSPTLTNCTISGNSAVAGGGMYNWGVFSGTANPTLTNCTISGNSSDYGGGMNNNGSAGPTLRNCILWENSARYSGNEVYNSSSAIKPGFAHCDIQGSSVNMDWIGTDLGYNIDADPLFVAPVPGTTPTTGGDLHLLLGSPCIDTGDNTAPNIPSTDFEGDPRILNGDGYGATTVDMGVDEVHTIYVDSSNTDGNDDGTSWATAFRDLQDGLAVASSGHFVLVAAGTYYPDEGAGQTNDARRSTFEIPSDVVVYGGYPTGGGTREWETNVTTLSGDLGQNDSTDGNGENAFHVVTLARVSSATILDGFTVMAGNADGSSSSYPGGGGIYNWASGIGTSSDPQLMNCTISGNNGSSGGGMSNYGTSGGRASPTLTNCTVSGNSADGGGGMSNVGFDGTASPTLTNCTISGNSAEVFGGGMFNWGYDNGTASPTLTNCILWGNSATTSVNEVYNNSATPTYSHCDIQGSGGSTSWAGPGTDGGNNIDADPLFFTPVPDTTPTTGGDLHLWPGSPCIDTGDNAAPNIPSTDFEGHPRILDGNGDNTATVDMGADEAHIIYVNSSSLGYGNGTSWATAFRYLQDGLAVASSGSLVLVAAGTYYPDEGAGQTNDARGSTFNIPSGVRVYGGYPTGGGTRDWETNVTTLSGDLRQNDSTSGNGENAFHVVTLARVSSATILDGFKVTAGNANGSSFSDGIGGGIYNWASGIATSSDPKLMNCIISGNNATYGGGMYNAGYDGGTAGPTLTNCTISGNSALYGGGMYNAGVSAGIASPTLTNCTISGNSASNGGGMFNAGYDNGTASPTLTNCILWGNSATTSGNEVYNNSATPTYSHCDIEGSGGSWSWTGPGTDGGNNIDVDPLFVAPVAGTTPTTGGDLHLQLGSPCIDTGDNAAPNIPSTDFDGDPRILDGNSDGTAIADMGVDEVHIIHVDSSNTDGDDDGTSWSTAFRYLQDGLAVASPGHFVLVAAGTYYPDEGAGQTNDARGSTFNIPSGGGVYGGYPTGGGTRDWEANVTTLSGDLGQNDSTSGNGENAFHVVTFAKVSSATILDGFKVTAGNANGSSFSDGRGGGIYNVASEIRTSSNPTLTNCIISGNNATYGGGMYNAGYDGGTAGPTLTNCTISGNSAERDGGGMYNYGYDGSIASPTLTNCTISGNSAEEYGGGMYNEGVFSGTASPTLTNCTISGNSASYGGGMNNSGIYGGTASPTLTNCILWGNSATTSGKEVYNNSATKPTYSHCDIQGSNGSGGSWRSVLGTDGGNNIDADPLFVASVPGTTPTTGGDLHLRLGSPCIDTGDNAAPNIPSTDFEGDPRTLDGDGDSTATADMGVDEVHTIYVDSSNTDGDDDGTSWASAFRYLQDGLAVASPGYFILVAAGTYYSDEGAGQTNDRGSTFNIPSGVEVYGGYPTGGGTRDLETNVTTLSGDLGQNDSTSGDGENAWNVVTFTNVSSATILDGFTVMAGNANGSSSFYHGAGGGIYNVASGLGTSSDPQLMNCTISGNSAKYDGGGMYNYGSSGGTASPTLMNCTISGNSADYGGGMNNYGSASPTLTNCTISGNSARYGGAMQNYLSASPMLTNCILWGNSATASGKEVYNYSATPTYSYCDIQGSNGSGGSWEPSLGTDGGNNIDADPLFVSPVPDTTPTTDGDLHLRPGSPCIDTANNAAPNIPSSDFEGDIRILDGDGDSTATVDMGVDEVHTIYVDSFNTDGDDDGISWATAFRYLQDGLAVASSGNFVLVATGTYYPDEGAGQTSDARGSTFNIPSGVRVYGGYPIGGGTRDREINVTTLSGDLGLNDPTSGNGENAFHVVTFTNVSSATILDGFTVTAGNTNGGSSLNRGGGIYNFASGIGIDIGSDPQLMNCIISGNSAYSGGGMYNEGVFSGTASPTLTNCTISGNSASYGGGMNNSGIYGGRAYPTLTNCTISGNSALYNGGGIHNEGDSGTASPTLMNCTISGNSAEYYGGGMYNWGKDSGTASPTLTNCTISGNSVYIRNGGGMYNTGSVGGMAGPTLTNCTISGNSAEDYGGGICNFASGIGTSSNPQLTNCTISGNSADAGGGMYNWGDDDGTTSPMLTNCILWGNSATTGNEVVNSSATPTYSYCDIQGSNGSGGSWEPSLGTDGGNNIDADPFFIAPVPGTTPTTGGDLHLGFGSPCIDTGDDATSKIPSTDFEGDPRILDGDGDSTATVDMGADEVSNFQPTGILLSPSTVNENEPIGTVVGNLTSTDPDPGDTHSYSLVSGTGDTDNACFTIGGAGNAQLLTTEVFDYETTSSYSIRVRTDDGSRGGNYEEVLTIAVLDVAEPVVVDASAWASGALTLVISNGMIHIHITGTTTDAVPPHAVGMGAEIIITGQDDVDDTLTIDFSGGNPIPPGGLSYEGGAGGTDSLVLLNGTFMDEVYDMIDSHSGSIDLDGSFITFTGLEPITSTITAANVILNFSNATETISIDDSGTAGQTTVTSTAAESVTFNNPSTSLTLNGGNGDNTFNCEGLDASWTASLIINDQAGTDTVVFQTNTTNTGGGDLSVTADTIIVDAIVNTGGGSVGLTASGDVIFNALVQSGGGNISITAADVSLDAMLSGIGTLTMKPSTASSTIGIGGGTGDFNLDDTELSNLIDGFSSITIGDTTSGTGTVDIDTATFLDPVIIAGGIIHDGSGTDITAPSLTLDGNVSPGQSPGILTVDGDVTFTADSTFSVEINGDTPGTEHDQLVVNGTVNLGGTPGTVLDMTYVVSAGAGPFVIVKNDGTDPISGRFENPDIPGDTLDDGETITITIGGNKFTLRIEYDFNADTGQDDNSGNDVAIVFDPDVIIPATPGDDQVLIRTDATGTLLEIYVNDPGIDITGGDLVPTSDLPTNPNLFLKVPITHMLGGSVTWYGLSGNDQVGVDYSAGTFFESAAHLPFDFDFGGQSGDFLLLTSADSTGTPVTTAFTAQSYTRGASTGEGTMVLTDTNGPQTITIAGLSIHIDDEVDIPAGGTVNVLGSSGADSITIEGSPSTSGPVNISDWRISFTGGYPGIDQRFKPNITINGQAGPDTVIFQTNTTNTGGGDLTVIADTITINAGVNSGGGDVILTASGDMTFNALVQSGVGNITITAAEVSLAAMLSGTGTLTMQPSTASSTIGIGGGTGDFNLDDTELSNLTDGFSSITIGDVTGGTGTVDIDTVTFLDPVIISGGIIHDGSGTDITAPAITLDGTVSPGQSPGILRVSVDVVLASDSTFSLEFGGATPGDIFTNHDQLSATGSVTIGTNVTLGTSSPIGYVPSGGEELMIIDRAGGSGTFNGYSEGATISVNFLGSGRKASITYVGGDGDDVAILVDNLQRDFGDAPDPIVGTSGIYPTLISGNGPRHILGSGLLLGAFVDDEVNGQPNLRATGDDSDSGVDDEDGLIMISTILAYPTSSTVASLVVTAAGTGSGNGYLDVWIDFDKNGVFDHPAEHLGGGTSIPLVDGQNLINFSVPAGASTGHFIGLNPGETFMRMRLSSSGGLLPTGEAADGEVEDHLVTIVQGDGTVAVTIDLQPIVGDINVLTSGGDLVVEQDGGIILFQAPVLAVGSIEITGSGEAEQLNIHWTNLPFLTFDGQGGSDPIVVIGSTVDDSVMVTSNMITGNSMSISYTNAFLKAVFGNHGDDALTIDFSGGTVVPQSQFTFHGGTGNDSLFLVGGGSFTGSTYRFISLHDGSVDIDGQVINYTGLDPITSTITVSTVTLNYSPTSETITAMSGGVGFTTVTSTAGETVTFTHPTTSLVINAGGGDDTITIQPLGTGFSADLSIDGSEGADRIEFEATTGPGAITLNGGLDNDMIFIADPFWTMDNILANIEANGGGGDNDSIILGDNNSLIPDPLTTVTNSKVTGISIGEISYTDFDLLIVDIPDSLPGMASIESTNAGTTTVVSIGGEGDDISVGNAGSLDDILGPLTIDDNFGAGPNDVLTYDDSNDPDSTTYTLSSNGSLIRNGGTVIPPITVVGIIETVRLHAGTGPNTIEVDPSMDTSFFIDGEAPITPLPADILSIDLTGITDVDLELIPSQLGMFGTLTFGSGEQPISFVRIETFDFLNGVIDLIIREDKSHDGFLTPALPLGSGFADDGIWDEIILGLDPAIGLYFHVTVNSIHQIAVTFGDGVTEGIVFVGVIGSGDDDTLIVDWGGENPIPPGEIHYDGGGQVGDGGEGDTLVLQNGTVGTVEHTYLGPHDGLVDVDGRVLTYTGLEPIYDYLVADHRIFNFGPASDEVFQLDNVVPGMNTLSSTSSSEITHYANPLVTMTVNLDEGDDSLTIGNDDDPGLIPGFDPAFSAALTINGESGWDTINVHGPVGSSGLPLTSIDFNVQVANLHQPMYSPDIEGTCLFANIWFPGLIQNGIDVAHPTDGCLITVYPGTYPENLTNWKPDIRLRSASGMGLTMITADSGVILELAIGTTGFTLGGAYGEGFTLMSTGAVERGVAGRDLVDLHVSYNHFKGPGMDYGIHIYGVTASDPENDSIIRKNTFDDCGTAIAILTGSGVTDLTITMNCIFNSLEHGMLFGPGKIGLGIMKVVVITENTISSSGIGIRIESGPGILADFFVIKLNNFIGNDIGILNEQMILLTAKRNYWGSTDGPYAGDNPNGSPNPGTGYGTGNPIQDYVLAEDWLTIIHHPSPCDLSIILTAGWNLISITVELDDLGGAYTASIFASEMNSQAGEDIIKYVVAYDNATGLFEEFVVDSGIGNDFPMEYGRAYYVYSTSPFQTVFHVVGDCPVYETFDLNECWNLIGWMSMQTMNVGEFSDMIDHHIGWYAVQAIVKYDTSYSYGENAYITWYPGMPDDLFQMTPGEAYWIFSASDISEVPFP